MHGIQALKDQQIRAVMNEMASISSGQYAALNPPVSCFCGSQKFLINLEDVKFCGTIFYLHKPICLVLYYDDGDWICENKDLSSVSLGTTPELAVHAFGDDFAVLWEEIGKAPDEQLTIDARKIKSALLSAVKGVQSELIPCR